MPDETEAEAVADLARRAADVNAAEIHEPEGERFHLVREAVQSPGGATQDRVRVLSMEAFAKRPYRRRGTVVFDDPASLVAYVNNFKAEGATRLYASLAGRSAVAVLNDDDGAGLDDHQVPDLGAWRDHRAELRVQPTPQWTRWRERSGAWGSQADFAEHLEINLADITDPVAADLVEIARSLTASNDVQFRSAVNLQSGEIRFAYDENVQAKATGLGGATIDVPKTFTLHIAVFQGTEPVDVTARLRYKLAGGNLMLAYILLNADDIEREQFHEQIEAVGTGVDLTPLYGGAPPVTTPQAWREP